PFCPLHALLTTPPRLPQRGDPVLPAGQQLMHVSLGAGVEDEPVGRRVEDTVQRDGQLDHPEVGPEMPPVAGYGLDEKVADLAGERGELVGAERLEIPGTGDGLQQGHSSAPHRRRPGVDPRVTLAGWACGPGKKREPYASVFRPGRTMYK